MESGEQFEIKKDDLNNINNMISWL
jgi:hypothetical protein